MIIIIKKNSYLNKFQKIQQIFQLILITIQVNTSGEENKGGIEPSEVSNMMKFVLEKCPNLQFRGLMTIGALAHSVAKNTEGPNPDFVTLIKCRK